MVGRDHATKGQGKGKSQGGLERPQHGGFGEATEGPWELGQAVVLSSLNALQLAPGCLFRLLRGASQEGSRRDQEDRVARGTDNEALLKAHSARPGGLFRCHICPPSCSRHEATSFTA